MQRKSMIEKGLVYAIIPARSGSVSIKDKNIRLLHGHPLLSYSIAAARMTNQINRIIVTTDSEKYATISREYGAETPFIRPKEISDNNSTDLEFMEHAISWFADNEGVLPEYWVHLRPTTPIRDPEIISKAITALESNEKATCLRSAHKTNDCPFKWFTKDGNGYYHTLTGISPDEANGPRQYYPVVYVPNGYVDVLRTEYIIDNHKLHGDKVLGFEVTPTVDIDYETDLTMANNCENNKLIEWLDVAVSDKK